MSTFKQVMWIFISCVLLLTVSCSSGLDLNNPRADEYDVQIIGDSIFDLSGDIQQDLKALSGKTYKDRSRSGAQIDGIVNQYHSAINNTPGIQTIIADGGGNDILLGNADCDTDPLTQGCLDVIDYVADKMEGLLNDFYVDGVDNCVWLGYYNMTLDQEEKNEAIVEAYSLYPAVFDDAQMNQPGSGGGAYPIDPRDDIVASDVKSDGIHPTASGSNILADLIYSKMEAEGMYR